MIRYVGGIALKDYCQCLVVFENVATPRIIDDNNDNENILISNYMISDPMVSGIHG